MPSTERGEWWVNAKKGIPKHVNERVVSDGISMQHLKDCKHPDYRSLELQTRVVSLLRHNSSTRRNSSQRMHVYL